MNFNSLRYS